MGYLKSLEKLGKMGKISTERLLAQQLKLKKRHAKEKREMHEKLLKAHAQNKKSGVGPKKSKKKNSKKKNDTLSSGIKVVTVAQRSKKKGKGPQLTLRLKGSQKKSKVNGFSLKLKGIGQEKNYHINVERLITKLQRVSTKPEYETQKQKEKRLLKIDETLNKLNDAKDLERR